MCGIFCIIKSKISKNNVKKYDEVLSKLRHRGPDNSSSWSSDRIYLGHTRLSIVGVGENSNQPYQFDNLLLVYNGEIFNYLELRDQLKQEGYTFQTESDTEVVIKYYHKYGVEAFSKFNGMWTIVIYDTKSDVTVVCRDRFGQKPLFFSAENGEIVFASEAFVINHIINSSPNLPAIKSFLEEGDFKVSGNTFFNKIFEFPEAS